MGHDNKFIFKKHIKDKLDKAYFGLGKKKCLRDVFAILLLLFTLRLRYGYGDAIYDQSNNDSFTDKI